MMILPTEGRPINEHALTALQSRSCSPGQVSREVRVTVDWRRRCRAARQRCLAPFSVRRRDGEDRPRLLVLPSDAVHAAVTRQEGGAMTGDLYGDARYDWLDFRVVLEDAE